MRILRRILVVAAVFVVVATAVGTGVYRWQRPMILTGTGYAAHNDCAVTEIGGRLDAASDLPANPIKSYLRYGSDGSAETTGSLLGVLAKQKAWYAKGFGCTLADARPRLGPASTVSADGNPFTHAPAPKSSAKLDAALGRAFGKGLSASDAAALGTRAVVVVKDGKLVAERYAKGFDATTPQLGWSMSKSATALITGMLVQQGKVTLDDHGLRPEWKKDGRADITVEQLLRMTSGLEWDETYDLGTPITQMLYGESDMGAYVAGRPAEHKPGTVQEYSSGSTTLLCSVLAQRTGLGADLPRQTLFRALGLSSAVLEPDAAGTPVCSSYLWATPRDWATIGQFALQNGKWHGKQLLPEDWMKRSLEVEPVDKTDDPGYGMTWRVNVLPDGSMRWPELPKDTYYASGHDGQKVIVVPSQDLVVVRMGFTPDADDEASEVALVDEVIGAGAR
ncbi:serine hydrolase domain-containing protein [Streptomyces sp. NPDC055955]|uniref:serine hydrolase domain-containing protein n=1 Tax=Streptomyces sp. NPDC055955 TaxID=3345665 RepID=UPI0035DF43CB